VSWLLPRLIGAGPAFELLLTMWSQLEVGGDDTAEAMNAFLQKRTPEFRDR